MTTTTDRVTHLSADSAIAALEAAGNRARLWRGGKVVRLYVGAGHDYIPVDAEGDVDIEDVRSCSSISGSQRRWALYEILRAAADR